MAAVVVAEVVTVVVVVIAVIGLLTEEEGDITTTWESFPGDFGRFRIFFANGRTDERTNPFIEMQVRI